MKRLWSRYDSDGVPAFVMSVPELSWDMLSMLALGGLLARRRRQIA